MGMFSSLSLMCERQVNTVEVQLCRIVCVFSFQHHYMCTASKPRLPPASDPGTLIIISASGKALPPHARPFASCPSPLCRVALAASCSAPVVHYVGSGRSRKGRGSSHA